MDFALRFRDGESGGFFSRAPRNEWRRRNRTSGWWRQRSVAEETARSAARFSASALLRYQPRRRAANRLGSCRGGPRRGRIFDRQINFSMLDTKKVLAGTPVSARYKNSCPGFGPLAGFEVITEALASLTARPTRNMDVNLCNWRQDFFACVNRCSCASLSKPPGMGRFRCRFLAFTQPYSCRSALLFGSGRVKSKVLKNEE
jgi:hypothetical protein